LAAARGGNRSRSRCVAYPDFGQSITRNTPMRSIFLYLIGIPIPIILLLAFCTHHF
jgi:hypothetical protein